MKKFLKMEGFLFCVYKIISCCANGNIRQAGTSRTDKRTDTDDKGRRHFRVAIYLIKKKRCSFLFFPYEGTRV